MANVGRRYRLRRAGLELDRRPRLEDRETDAADLLQIVAPGLEVVGHLDLHPLRERWRRRAVEDALLLRLCLASVRGEP